MAAKTYLDNNGNPTNAHGAPAYLDETGEPIAVTAPHPFDAAIAKLRASVPQPAGINGEELPVVGPANRFLTNTAVKGGDYLKKAAIGAVTPIGVTALMDAWQRATQPTPQTLDDVAGQIGGNLGIDSMAVAQDASNRDWSGLLNDAAIPAAGAILGGRVIGKAMNAPVESGVGLNQGMSEVSGRTLGGAIADVPGAALPGKIIPEIARTAGPELAQSARASGVVPSGEAGPSVVRGWANDALSRIESHVDQLHEAAGGSTEPVNLKQLADSLGNEEATYAKHSPSRSQAYGTMRQRVQAVETVEDLRNLKKALNRESDPAQNTTSNADQSHAIQAAGTALKGLRDAQYQWLADRTGVPAQQVQALMQRENAVMDMRDMFGRAEPAVRNADAAANAPTTIGSKGAKLVRFLTGHQPMVKVMVNGTEQMLPTSALGDFNHRAGKFMSGAPEVPVHYPEPVPSAVNRSHLQSLAGRMGLNQPQTAVPSGPSSTPFDEFNRLNPPAYQTPDMGQAAAVWGDDPAYQVPTDGQPRFLPRRGNLMLQDIEAAGPPPPKDPPPWWDTSSGVRGKPTPQTTDAADLASWILRRTKRH